MEENRRLEVQWRGLLLFAYLVAFLPIVLGGNPSRAQSTIRDKQMPETLAITISVPPLIRSCSHPYVSIKAEITNIGSEDVAIDKVGLRYRLSLRKSRASREGGSSRESTIQGDYGPLKPNEDSYVVLKPGQSYKAKIQLPLEPDFFDDAGEYKLILTYGQFRDYMYFGVPLVQGTVSSQESAFQIGFCNRRGTRGHRRLGR